MLEFTRYLRQDERAKRKNKTYLKRKTRHRSGCYNNESHEQFFMWDYLRFSRQKAHHTSLNTHSISLHSPGSPMTSAIYETKIVVNTQHAPKQPYYTYNLCCFFFQTVRSMSKQTGNERKLSASLSIDWWCFANDTLRVLCHPNSLSLLSPLFHFIHNAAQAWHIHTKKQKEMLGGAKREERKMKRTVGYKQNVIAANKKNYSYKSWRQQKTKI